MVNTRILGGVSPVHSTWALALAGNRPRNKRDQRIKHSPCMNISNTLYIDSVSMSARVFATDLLCIALSFSFMSSVNPFPHPAINTC